jgi:dTDP-4-amino-4,6-dideoxygalactose transaminase
MSAAAAVNSGTAALHLVLLALGVGSGDEVIIPSFVCSALLNALRYTGATPVLADIDPESLNIDPQDAREKVTGRTRAVIVPHLFGLPADLSSLMKLNVPVIEDCAQAPGATYDGQPAGSFGHAAVFSFYATKMITTGEGGMVVSRSTDLIDRVRELRAYDRREDDRVRYNYKMNEIQAAIGRVQLQRLDAFIERRRAIAGQYHQLLAPLPFRLPPRDPGHVYYRFVIHADGDVSEWMQILSKKHIHCARPVFMPLHRYLGRDSYPATTTAWRQCLSIPIYPSLTDSQVKYIARSLAEAAEETSHG